MYKLFIGMTLILTVLTSCAPKTHDTEITQLQIREIQTRVYDVDDQKVVMKALINVLQDDGYIVKNAVTDLGLISAQKEVDVENTSHKVCSQILLGANARWSKHNIMEASANVTEYGDQVQVRINFQSKTLDNFGSAESISLISDEEHYRNFFSKVDKSIFLQQQNI